MYFSKTNFSHVATKHHWQKQNEETINVRWAAEYIQKDYTRLWNVLPRCIQITRTLVSLTFLLQTLNKGISPCLYYTLISTCNSTFDKSSTNCFIASPLRLWVPKKFCLPGSSVTPEMRHTASAACQNKQD